MLWRRTGDEVDGGLSRVYDLACRVGLAATWRRAVLRKGGGERFCQWNRRPSARTPGQRHDIIAGLRAGVTWRGREEISLMAEPQHIRPSGSCLEAIVFSNKRRLSDCLVIFTCYPQPSIPRLSKSALLAQTLLNLGLLLCLDVRQIVPCSVVCSGDLVERVLRAPFKLLPDSLLLLVQP